jgi:translation elongation factor EF-Tu-like GTPase
MTGANGAVLSIAGDDNERSASDRLHVIVARMVADTKTILFIEAIDEIYRRELCARA